MSAPAVYRTLFHAFILIKPVAGIAAPTAVGAEVSVDITDISFQLALH